MTDYAIEGSDYERLQRENARLKAERDLAVRVAVAGCKEIDWQWIETFPDGATWHGIPIPDVRKVLAWYREAQDAANDDGAR